MLLLSKVHISICWHYVLYPPNTQIHIRVRYRTEQGKYTYVHSITTQGPVVANDWSAVIVIERMLHHSLSRCCCCSDFCWVGCDPPLTIEELLPFAFSSWPRRMIVSALWDCWSVRVLLGSPWLLLRVPLLPLVELLLLVVAHLILPPGSSRTCFDSFWLVLLLTA